MAAGKRSTWRIILIVVIVIFIAIQFIPVKRDNPPVKSDIPAPADVKAILHRACYNCHSNETKWPWYSHVAPASWLVTSDVHEARSHMDWSDWNQYDAEDQHDFIEHIWKLVNSGDMPLWYYKIAHPESKLTVEDKMKIKNWVQSVTADTNNTGSMGDDLQGSEDAE